jgi:hypothetical protein
LDQRTGWLQLPDPDTDKAAWVTQAMMGMTKFDVAALQQAFAAPEPPPPVG